MSKIVRGIALASLAALLASAAVATMPWSEFELLVKAGGVDYFYDYDDLKGFSTQDLSSLRGTKKGAGIPLTLLMTRDTGIAVEEIEHILVVSEERSMLLEGEHLQHLDKLWVKLGTLRPAIYPEDDATWQALQPTFGQPRFKDLERVYVYVKGQLK